MNKNIFMNIRNNNIFDKKDYNIEKTVYNNFDKNKFTYDINLLNNDTTCETLKRELDMKNANRQNNVIFILSHISFNLNLITFAKNNNLLLDTDYTIIFLNLIVDYDTNYNDILNFVVDNSISLRNDNLELVNRVVFNILNKDKEKCSNLFDWYSKKNRKVLSFILGYLLFTQFRDFVLERAKYYNIYSENEYYFICVLSLVYNFNDLNNIYNINSIDVENMSNESYNMLINNSVQNKDDKLFYYFNNKRKYMCGSFDVIFYLLKSNKFNVLEAFLNNITCELNIDKIIELCCEINHADNNVHITLLNFVFENMKIDIHYKNDIIIKNFIMDEKYEIVKYLIEKYKFDFADMKMKKQLEKIINFLENNELIKLLKKYIN